MKYFTFYFMAIFIFIIGLISGIPSTLSEWLFLATISAIGAVYIDRNL